MAEVSIAYKGSVITEMNDAGSKTLKTGGYYCEGDVTVSYTPRVDDSFRRWDVSVSGTISSNFVNILQDDWLKQHRADANLCVALIPKFPVPYVSGKGNQGVFLTTNQAIMTDSSGVSYKSVSGYVHSNGGTNCRARKYGLTGASDVGDMEITSAGMLRAIALANYPFAPGEYCVIACLM